MESIRGYVLGQSRDAARRLEIQDAHFAENSERLLDELALRTIDRVVELGCGAGGLSRRIYKRLSAGGVLIGVDCTEGLLNQAAASLKDQGAATFQPVLGDLTSMGSWLNEADIVAARTVLHHVPMVELFLGRLRAALRPGTRVGFIEPDFRSLLGRVGYLEATGRTELEPLRVWATVINTLYQVNRISPDVGASLARTLEIAGYRNVKSTWQECRSDEMMIENMLMFYDEVRDRLAETGILSREETSRQQELLRALPAGAPAVWGTFRVTCDA